MHEWMYVYRSVVLFMQYCIPQWGWNLRDATGISTWSSFWSFWDGARFKPRSSFTAMCDAHSCGRARFFLLRLHQIPNRSRCRGQIVVPKMISYISKTPLKAIDKKAITVSLTGSDTIRLCWSMYSLQGQLEKWVLAVSYNDTRLHGLTYLANSIFAIGAIAEYPSTKERFKVKLSWVDWLVPQCRGAAHDCDTAVAVFLGSISCGRVFCFRH